MSFLKNLWSYEPAVIAWAATGGLAALVAFVFHTTDTQTAAITTICAGLATIVTAVQARPVAVPLITGAVSTIAVAVGAFGLHASSAEIASGVTVLSGILALILRQNVTPAATLAAQKPVPVPSPTPGAMKPNITK